MARPGGRLDLDVPKAKLTKDNLREAAMFLPYLRPYLAGFVGALFTLLISGLMALSFPALAGSIMDAATPGGHFKPGLEWLPHNLNTLALLMLGVLAFQSACTFYYSTNLARVGQSAVADLRRDTYARLISLPMSFFGQRRVGELASRLSADLAQIEGTVIMVLPQLVRQSMLLIGGIVLLSTTSPRLTLIMLAVLPVLTILSVTFGRTIRKNAREAQDKLAESGTIVEETLTGIFNVKAFVNEAFEIQRYRQSMDAMLKVSLRGAWLRGAFIAFIVFSLFGCIVLALWSGATLMQKGQLTLGQMTQFGLYTVFVAGAMGQFADLYSQLQKGVGATQRVREILQEKPEFAIPPLPETAGGGTVARPPLRGEVDFCDVHFRYPSRSEVEVLKGISFSVKHGEKIALVGPSGSGKSTIIALILRFYDPSPGEVRFDGKPAGDYPLDWLRNQMSVVPQEAMLFGGTIFENIAYGRPAASEAEVMEAARQAYAHDFIEAFPEKYQTKVGERGVKLSGGQRQRVAIARAILKNPAILILDEATSSLDAESERLVQLALDRLMENRTTVMIAHRLATVRRADRILVIKDGVTLESGTHAELNQQENGLYRRLAELQFDLSRS